MNKYLCPICGFYLDEPPKDYLICPSCGVEFDADTASFPDRQTAIQMLRYDWKLRGMEWSSPVVPKPSDFNPLRQLARLQQVQWSDFIVESTFESDPENVIGAPRKKTVQSAVEGITSSGIVRNDRYVVHREWRISYA